MAVPSIRYAVEVHKKFTTYWPAWLPNEQVELGAYGELQHGILFKRLGNVAECGVSQEALESKKPTSHGNVVFRSQRKVRLGAVGHAANTVALHHVPAGHVGARVVFTQGQAAFLAAIGVISLSLQREQALRTELKQRLERGEAGGLESHHVVVTDVLKARSGHAFISTAAGQAVTLHAKAGVGAGRLDLAHIQGGLDAALESDDLLAYEGKAGMTPLFKLVGFKVGKQIRDLFRVFARDRNLIRIRVEAIRATPKVGTQIVVSPLPAQSLVIAPTDSRPFSVDAADVSPFSVEPTLIHSRTVDRLFPSRASLRDIDEPLQAPLIGMLAGEPGVDSELIVRPVGAVPVIIEPVDGDPFLVNLVPENELTLGPSNISYLEEAVPGERTVATDSDPFSLDYVDFDAELDAAADELDLD